MKLELSVKETNQLLETFEASDWVEAVKFVEEHKQRFLDQGFQELVITNQSSQSVCFWKLESGKRSPILADKLHKNSSRF